MIPFRAALLIDASPPAVRSALWSMDTWRRAAAAAGLAAEVAGPDREELRPGDLVRIAGGRRRMLLRVGTSPFPAVGVLVLRGVGSSLGLLVTVTPAATAAGTLVTVDVRTGGRRRAAARRVATLHRAQLLLGVLCLAARERDAASVVPAGSDASAAAAGGGAPPAAAGSDAPVVPAGGDAPAVPEGGAPRVVVAGVVIRDGAILAARRTYPVEVAGRWECPGGKVEPGESEQQALVRELTEELGITVAARDRVGPALPLDGGYRLHAYRADLIEGEPQAREHDAVRWVAAAELDAVDWLPSDRPLVPFLRRLLQDGARSAGRDGLRDASAAGHPVTGLGHPASGAPV
ncbi:MAG TPA: (deoxy)nucleoside triphosphate pyrophosphohydrolase [Nakamurella sp.]|nr:(deoxy)nucleoside triphosphate pyrophosphohydrolase [Nakamurella sp.]